MKLLRSISDYLFPYKYADEAIAVIRKSRKQSDKAIKAAEELTKMNGALIYKIEKLKEENKMLKLLKFSDKVTAGSRSKK